MSSRFDTAIANHPAYPSGRRVRGGTATAFRPQRLAHTLMKYGIAASTMPMAMRRARLEMK